MKRRIKLIACPVCGGKLEATNERDIDLASLTVVLTDDGPWIEDHEVLDDRDGDWRFYCSNDCSEESILDAAQKDCPHARPLGTDCPDCNPDPANDCSECGRADDPLNSDGVCSPCAYQSEEVRDA